MTSAYDQGRIPDFEMRHRLQLAREFAGYDRDQLAAAMEVSRNSVYNAETGRTVPRKIMLNAWALACGVPVTWLITGESPGGGPEPTSRLGIIRTDDDKVIQLRPSISAAQRHQPVLEDDAA